MLSVGLAMEPTTRMRSQAGLVGPNAVIQLAAALRAGPAEIGTGTVERVFTRAGFSRLLVSPPDAMIDEAIPARLFEALWRELPAHQASAIAHDAGRRTGAYVLANRIPAAVRRVLNLLPRLLASRLLLKSIEKNAWTFAGSGDCSTTPGNPAIIAIANNPLAMPGCVWHVGVFECLFRALVSRQARVRHADCRIEGAPVCQFEIDISAGTGTPKDQGR